MIRKRPSTDRELLPTVICSWCKQVLRAGVPKISHGICSPCAATFFGRNLPEPIVIPA
jgi:hypothetical protein